MNLTKQTIWANYREDVAGYTFKAVPGLAVNYCRQNKKWVLTHINSGLSCGRNLASKRLAVDTLRNLPAAGIDWTLDKDTLLTKYQEQWRPALDRAIGEAGLGHLRQRLLFSAT